MLEKLHVPPPLRLPVSSAGFGQQQTGPRCDPRSRGPNFVTSYRPEVGLAAFAAAALVSAQRRRRCSIRQPTSRSISSSDDLLHQSLNAEVNKMKSGKLRNADVSESRPASNSPGLTQTWGGSSSKRESRSYSSTSDVSVASRLIGAACFIMPLVAAIPYGSTLFVHSKFLREALLRPLLPIIKVFFASRFANLISIVALYGLIAKNRSLSPFTRAIGLQASTLMMVQFPANFLLQFFAATPGPLANLASGTIFLYFVVCVVLGVLSCLEGRLRNLPLIGTGVSGPNFSRGGPSMRIRGSS